jgi:putative restriction endonuclease
LFAVIAENDESKWDDDTGTIYHFPKRYVATLSPGVKLIYYKGGMRNVSFAASRLSVEPHYFGMASIGSVHLDKKSAKGDLFATIEGYVPFDTAVLAKQPSGAYYEQIPPSRVANYWRDGVRSIDETVYAAILAATGILSNDAKMHSDSSHEGLPPDDEFESGQEGTPTLRYVTTYERNPRYRRQALAIHGYRCAACEVHFGEKYGPYAEGVIHVHHTKPVSLYDAPRRIDPAKDLVPVCPSCHAVIHRNKSKTLTIEELRAMLAAAKQSGAGSHALTL